MGKVRALRNSTRTEINNETEENVQVFAASFHAPVCGSFRIDLSPLRDYSSEFFELMNGMFIAQMGVDCHARLLENGRETE